MTQTQDQVAKKQCNSQLSRSVDMGVRGCRGAGWNSENLTSEWRPLHTGRRFFVHANTLRTADWSTQNATFTLRKSEPFTFQLMFLTFCEQARHRVMMFLCRTDITSPTTDKFFLCVSRHQVLTNKSQTASLKTPNGKSSPIVWTSRRSAFSDKVLLAPVTS